MLPSDIQIIKRISPAHVRARFSGAYRQPEVNWQADIMSLQNYRSLHPDFVAQHGQRTALMAVGNLETGERRIIIALPLQQVADADVLKAVTMVRNYRALKEGLRQWSG